MYVCISFDLSQKVGRCNQVLLLQLTSNVSWVSHAFLVRMWWKYCIVCIPSLNKWPFLFFFSFRVRHLVFVPVD